MKVRRLSSGCGGRFLPVMTSASGVFGRIEAAGAEHVAFCRDPAAGLRALVVIGSTVRGPALCGVRIQPYADADAALDDGLRLAESMTVKSAAAGVRLGGSVIVLADPHTGKDARLLSSLARRRRARDRLRDPPLQPGSGPGHRGSRGCPERSPGQRDRPRVGDHPAAQHRVPARRGQDRDDPPAHQGRRPRAAGLPRPPVTGRSWPMTRALSTPPVIPAGVLAGSPQPVLPATQGLLLRPWGPANVPAFLSAYADDEIRRWHAPPPHPGPCPPTTRRTAPKPG
jgi:hypothetical protein